MTLPADLPGLFMITVHPERMAPPALAAVDALVALGPSPAETIDGFCAAAKLEAPSCPDAIEDGQALLWRRGEERAVAFRLAEPRTEGRRHVRKYAEGDLGADRSFYFRGPDERLNLRASNLLLFLQMADGVDDETWMHHLRRGDYARWFREAIKDDDLADAAEAAGRDVGDDPAASRRLIREAIESRYTLAG